MAGSGASGLRNGRATGPEIETTEHDGIGVNDAVPLTLNLTRGAICEIGREEAKQPPSLLHPEEAAAENIAALQSALASFIAAPVIWVQQAFAVQSLESRLCLHEGSASVGWMLRSTATAKATIWKALFIVSDVSMVRSSALVCDPNHNIGRKYDVCGV